VRATFLHGIRFRLFLAALVLLAIPALAAQFISRMEAFLRNAQEQDIAATARVASLSAFRALSSRRRRGTPGRAAAAVGLFAQPTRGRREPGHGLRALGGDRAFPDRGARAWRGYAPRVQTFGSLREPPPAPMHRATPSPRG
jgi:hypothetical protein